MDPQMAAKATEKNDLSSGLPNRLSVIVAIISHCTRRDVFQSAFDLFDREAKGRVIVDSALDQIERMDRGRMIPAEMFADAGKRVVGELTAEIHRDLPAERDTLGATLRFEVRQPNVE
jgi:hypothetical protein